MKPIVVSSALLLALLFFAVDATAADSEPGANNAGGATIEFTSIPFTDKGGTQTTGTIEGRVVGGRRDQLIVLYAKSGAWYVQPFFDQPYTVLDSNLSWINSTHLGTEYAALLVEHGYVPPQVTDALPQPGNGVIAVKIVAGTPFFWQTWWFRSLLLVTLLALVLLLLRLRQRRVIRELNLKFEQRLAERTRIAQELHDTLLQGLLSASMQLHVADDQLPADSPAKPRVARVLELMGHVIDEGRNAVRGLRAAADPLELEEAFARIQEELPRAEPIDYHLSVEGTSRPLRPAIQDEVYRVGHEALINAFRHAEASRIELELEYTAKIFKVLVRDNGNGIDPNVVAEGKDGHWGLSGMRERAEGIGGTLRVWSRARAGTEVELTIPSQIAYEADGTGGNWLTRFVRGRRRSPAHGK